MEERDSQGFVTGQILGFFCSAENEAQGLVHAKQALCH